MLAHIQELPEGELKENLLSSFLRTMLKTTQPQGNTVQTGRQPIFIDASYERNTRSFMQKIRNERLQPLTIGDVSREINVLKSNVAELKDKVQRIENGTTEISSYKTDAWERQELWHLQAQMEFL